MLTALCCLVGCSGLDDILTDRSSVVVNEVVSTNKNSHLSEEFGSPDWVELYNTGNAAVDLSGCGLSDNVLEPRRFVFPEGTVIAGGEYLMVYCISDGESDHGMLVAPFGLSRTGEDLLLTDTYTQVIQHVEVPELNPDVSYARRDDGTYGYSAYPTFAESNIEIVDELSDAIAVIDPVDALRFTEIVNGAQGWVELVNHTAEPIQLEDYYLSDDPEHFDKWRFPEMTLGAGEYVVVELCGVDEEDTLNASFKVSSSESAIYLFNNLFQRTDTLEFDPALPDGVSAVVTEEGVCYTTHITKGSANSTSTFAAIEWTDMTSSDPIRINEFLPDNLYSIIDAEGDRCEWVELWNTTDAPVSLLGYYLSDRRNDPTKWALPNVEIPAGGYLLIFLSGKDSSEGELHASFRISSVDEGIFLFNYDGMRMDSMLIPEGLSDNVSIGRSEGDELRYYTVPTPNAPNTTYGFASPVGLGGFDADSVYISEVSGVSEARSGRKDWVELYNGSSSSLVLDGWYLTDNPEEPNKFSLKNFSIYANGYTVIYCSTASDEQSSSTAPIGIGGSGDTLYLVAPDGSFRDVFETGVTGVGVTSGRANGTRTGERVFFDRPTRGGANAEPLSGYAAEPVFSHIELFCDAPFMLELTCATENAVIHYTTNGSAPTEASPIYAEPISIDSNTVIRAIAVHPGLVNSPEAAHTFLFEDEHSVPVVCLSLSRSDFNSMYTASQTETGSVIKGDEVPCFMEYYEEGKLATYTGAGVRVSGASTALYPQKSLALYFRAGYGRSSMDYPFFEDCDITSFRSLLLRNGGQDALYARVRDAYISRICQGLNVDVSYVQPVAVYINGEYWGLYDLKENINEDFFVSRYGIDRNNIDIIKRNGTTLAGTNYEWYWVREFCRSGQTEENLYSNFFSYESNYERLCEYLDVNSLMDYLCCRTYFFDGDMFNQKYWRARDYSVKWRAILYDSDFAMHGNNINTNLLSLYFNPNGVAAAHGSLTNMDLYCAVNQNAGWREQFIVRYIYIVKYVFAPERALSIYDKLVSEIEPEMTRHISRWPNQIRSYSAWQGQVDSLRSCIKSRQAPALRYLRYQYSLSEERFAELEARADAIYETNG